MTLSEILGLYDPTAPLERAFTIPAEWYTDPRIEALERDRVFAPNWIAVGRTDQVEKEGDFFTIELAGEPLVVVRGAAGRLHAFFNVCRHHAAAVCTTPCGNAQHLRCPYHGWTYSLDGALKGAPEFLGVENFDRAQFGLVPIQVDVWEQFVFVRLSETGPELSAFLGDLPAAIAPLVGDEPSANLNIGTTCRTGRRVRAASLFGR